LIGHHPLWPIAISDLTLSDYEDAPWSRHIRVAPASVLTNPTISNNSSEEDAILRARTQIYDSLGSMGELSVAQRITTVRNSFQSCLNLAAQSARNCKMNCVFLVELENRLKVKNANAPSVCVRMTAVDSSLS